MLSTLIADLDALDARLRDRAAVADPKLLAEAARVVRAVVGALGTSQSGLARAMGVGEKSMRDWCAAKSPPGPLALRAMRLLVERLVSPPAEPAEGESRRALCARALGPKLEALMERAEAAGWHPEEIAATVLAWAKGRGGGASLRDGTRPR